MSSITSNISFASSVDQNHQDYTADQLALDWKLLIFYFQLPNSDYLDAFSSHFSADFELRVRMYYKRCLTEDGNINFSLLLTCLHPDDKREIQEYAEQARQYSIYKEQKGIHLETRQGSSNEIRDLLKKMPNVRQLYLFESYLNTSVLTEYLEVLPNLKIIYIHTDTFTTLPSFTKLTGLKTLIYNPKLIRNLEKIEELKKIKSGSICHVKKNADENELNLLTYRTVLEWEYLFDGFLKRFYKENPVPNSTAYKAYIEEIFKFLPLQDIQNIGKTSHFFRFETLEKSPDLSAVKIFNLSKMNLKELPSFFKKMVNLEELNLNGLPLTTFPEEILGFKSLQKLDLATATSIIIPAEIKKLIRLKTLVFNGSSENEIPESVKTLIIARSAAHKHLEQITTIEKNAITLSWIFSFADFFKPTFPKAMYGEIKKYLSFTDRCQLSKASRFFNKIMIEHDKLDFAKNWTIISFAVNFPKLEPLVSSYLDEHEEIYNDKTTNRVQKTELSILNVQKSAKAILVEMNKDDFPFHEETEVDFSDLVELVFLVKDLFSSKKQIKFFLTSPPRNWFSLHSNPVRTLPIEITNSLIKMTQLKELDLANLVNLEEVPEILLKIPNTKVTLPIKLRPSKASSSLANRDISVIDTDSPSLLSRMWAAAKTVMLYVAKALLVIALFAAFATMVAGGLYLAGYPLALETLSSQVGLG